MCNETTGKIITVFFGNFIPNIRYGFKRFYVPEAYCNGTVKAMLFWGFYESAEMRLIPKYINVDLPVIELGASLGIVSCRAIARLQINSSYTCIEANPYLVPFIKKNIALHHPTKKEVVVENLAIAYGGKEEVNIQITGNNTQGRINYEDNNNAAAVYVKTSSLLAFSAKPYTLICDIEGMEIEVLKHDAAALDNCKYLFIELHKAWYLKDVYEVEALKTLIINMGFSLIERDGNVFYFAKAGAV